MSLIPAASAPHSVLVCPPGVSEWLQERSTNVIFGFGNPRGVISVCGGAGGRWLRFTGVQFNSYEEPGWAGGHRTADDIITGLIFH